MASSARIDELQKKFEENPRRYFAPLANEYRKAGDVEQAIAICREYLPQQPGHMSGHIVYGQALYEARQFEEGKTVFETALSLDPENLIALRHLGDIALILGDTEGARSWYGRVLEADPRNEEIQAQLKSLEGLAPAAPAAEAAATPAAAEPAAAEPAAATPAEAAVSPSSPTAEVSLPPVEKAADAPVLLDMIGESPADRPPASPASSAETVVVSAVKLPAIERTVEQPAMSFTPPPVETLGSAPTAEITLDNVPAPKLPELENLAAPAGEPPSDASMAPGFESTHAAAEPPLQLEPMQFEAPVASNADAAPIDSFRLDGLEPTQQTSMPTPVAVPSIDGLDLAMTDTTSAAEPPAASPAAAQPADMPPVEASPVEASPVEPSPSLESSGGTMELTELPAADPTADLPMLDVSLATPEPPAAPAPSAAPVVAAAPVAASEPGPFVTETMAELYLSQGHRAEALRVYRALVDQRPGDASLRAKLEKMQADSGPTIRELLARVAARRPAKAPAAAAASPATAAPTPSMDAQPAQPPAVAAPVAVQGSEMRPAASGERGGARADAIAAFLGATAPSDDAERAAAVLASAFSEGGSANGQARSGSSEGIAGTPARPASKDLSLDAVFGSAPSQPAPASFSFDQFFSQRANPEGSAGGAGAAPGQESRDDVARFTQWLEGLKQR